MNMSGRIHKISVSDRKGTKKQNVERVILRPDHGIVGDAHAGSSRQVSLLCFESFAKVKNDIFDVQPGDFAENITTIGLDLNEIKVGQSLFVGDNIELMVTQIGKECHHGCRIRQIVGECIMPREGVFARVVKGDRMQVGDTISRRSREV